MVCQVCGKPRQNIGPQKSALMLGHTFLACESCRANKFEPRHLIIIVGRSKGPAAVSKYINKHLYVGETIMADEVIV